MKTKLLGIFIFILLTKQSQAQWVSIPDSNFAKCLLIDLQFCLHRNANMSFELDTSCLEVQNLAAIGCANWGIFNIEGIQYFPNLIYLNCSFNNLTESYSIRLR